MDKLSSKIWMPKKVTYDEALGQPPDYSQTMRMQQPTLQQTNQYRHEYQIGSPDQNRQQLPGANHQNSPQQYGTMNQLNGQGTWVAATVTQPQVLGRLNYTEREKKTTEKRDIRRRLSVLSGITSFLGFHQHILVSPMQRYRNSITFASHMHT